MSQREWFPDVVEIGDRIARLTVAQATLLNRYLVDVYGIESPAGSDMPPTPEPDLVIDEGKVVPTHFDLVLEGCDPVRRINVIRTVRDLFGLGLKEARDTVEAAPRTIRGQLSEAEAQGLKTKLEAAGGRMALRPSA